MNSSGLWTAYGRPEKKGGNLRLKLIGCEVLCRELCQALVRCRHHVDVEFLPKGLHDLGAAGMLARLQEVLARVDESKYEAILLGYALCGNGIVGLQARTIPLVVPRGHDCITLLLGSRQRYHDYFNSHPGVYFTSTGWLERGQSLQQTSQLSLRNETGIGYSYEELLEKYGEENARFLFDQLCNYTRNYGQMTYIEMGIEPDNSFEQKTVEEAEKRGWRYEKLQGDMRLFNQLLGGEWNPEDFLVVRPGCRIKSCYDERIVDAVEADKQVFP
jgi:hypothetical protein